jgi:hypothetical protein
LWQEDAAVLFQLAGNNNFAFSLTAGVPEPSTFAVWSLLGLAACGTFSLAQAFGKRRMYDKSRFGKDVVPSRVS